MPFLLDSTNVSCHRQTNTNDYFPTLSENKQHILFTRIFQLNETDWDEAESSGSHHHSSPADDSRAPSASHLNSPMATPLSSLFSAVSTAFFYRQLLNSKAKISSRQFRPFKVFLARKAQKCSMRKTFTRSSGSNQVVFCRPLAAKHLLLPRTY